jgi:hypothetical protein
LWEDNGAEHDPSADTAPQPAFEFAEGKLKYRESVIDGIDRHPKASSRCSRARTSASSW